MKKRLLTAVLATILTLSLAACGDNDYANLPAVSGGDNSVLGTDFQKDMSQSTNWLLSNICETDEGYYFEYSGMLYFLNKENGESTILCGKPDCDHRWAEGGTCNAQVDTQMFLTYYDGKIYFNNSTNILENGRYVDKGERLFSMNLDGTEHEVVQNLDFSPGSDTNMFVNTPMVHRGNVYFCYSGVLYKATLGDDIKNATKIYGNETVSDGSMILDPNAVYYELWADGDMVYFMAKNVKQPNGTYKDTLFSYDPRTNKSEKVWQVPDKADVGTWDTTGVSVSQWYISNGYIYFFLCGNDIWYTELATGETNKLIDLDLEAGSAIFSNEYIAVINKEYSGMVSFTGESSVTGGDTLYIYGYDGKLVKEISLKEFYEDNENVTDCNLLWVSDDKVYIHVDATTVGGINANTGVSTPTINRHYIYYADIISGSIEQTGWSDVD